MAASPLRCAFGSPGGFSSDGGIPHPGSSFVLGMGGWRQASGDEEESKEGALSWGKACFWQPHLKGRID